MPRAAADGREAACVCYVAKRSAFEAPPSEAYLVAIHVHLREHWPFWGESIVVRRVAAAAAVAVAAAGAEAAAGAVLTEDVCRWAHPGAPRLSLEALLVEVNALRTTPWTMPRTIGEITAKLRPVLHRLVCRAVSKLGLFLI